MLRIPEYLSARIPFFYGYLVALLAVWALVCSSPGQTFAIMAFTPHLSESLSLSKTQVSGAYMLGTILAAVPLTSIGLLADRLGLQLTTTLVALGLCLACWFISFASGFVTLFLGFLLLRFLGQGALSLLPGNMVSMWFQLRLGKVNAAMSLGIAGAFGIVPGVLIWSIDEFGWRATYVAMGCFVAATLLPLMLLLRNRPEDLGLLPYGLAQPLLPTDSTREDRNSPTHPVTRANRDLTLKEALRSRALWILGIGMGVWALSGTGIIFFALEIYQEFGIPKEQVQLLFGTFSASMLVAQVGGGILADRYAMNRLLCLGFSLLAAGACLVPMTGHSLHMHAFALLFGAGQGLAIVTSSTLWVRYYGREHLGKIRGAIWCTTVAGSGCGPFLLGSLRDTMHSYTPGLWLIAIAMLPLGPMMLLATPPARETTATS